MTIEDVISELKNKTPRPGRLSPIINMDDNQIYMNVYMGMGNSDAISLDKYHDVIKSTILELYRLGQLMPVGERFIPYPGSDSYKTLELQ